MRSRHAFTTNVGNQDLIAKHSGAHLWFVGINMARHTSLANVNFNAGVHTGVRTSHTSDRLVFGSAPLKRRADLHRQLFDVVALADRHAQDGIACLRQHLVAFGVFGLSAAVAAVVEFNHQTCGQRVSIDQHEIQPLLTESRSVTKLVLMAWPRHDRRHRHLRADQERRRCTLEDFEKPLFRFAHERMWNDLQQAVVDTATARRSSKHEEYQRAQHDKAKNNESSERQRHRTINKQVCLVYPFDHKTAHHLQGAELRASIAWLLAQVIHQICDLEIPSSLSDSIGA